MTILGLLTELPSLQYVLTSPLWLLGFAFQIWMFIDAVRREEWAWAVFILIFSFITAIFYYFMVYRDGGPTGSATRGFELPGAHDRRRIKDLESKIHHLDKAHHHSQLGDIYFQQGKLEKAEACYRAAMERDPSDIDTRSHLGQCLLRMKRAADAKPLLESVCKENRKHEYGYSLMALAETHMALAEPDLAIQCWEQVLQEHTYARAKTQLAELYIHAGKKDRAKHLLEEAIIEDAYAPGFQRKREKYWVRRAKSLHNKVA